MLRMATTTASSTTRARTASSAGATETVDGICATFRLEPSSKYVVPTSPALTLCLDRRSGQAPRDRAGIAQRPAAGVYGGQEVLDQLVEQRRLLQVAGVAGAGQHHQRGRRDRALQHQRGVQAALVLIAGDD